MFVLNIRNDKQIICFKNQFDPERIQVLIT